MNKTTIYLISNNIANKQLINDKNNDNIEFRIKKLSLNNEGINNSIKLINYFHNINYIYSSTYNTAIETSNYLSTKLKRKVRLDNRLDLRRIGITKLSQLPNYYYEQSYLDINYKLQGGESQQEVRNRMNNFINEIINKHKNKKIIAVTHNICILYLIRKWNNIKYEDTINIKDPIIYKLTINDNKEIDIKYLPLTN